MHTRNLNTDYLEQPAIDPGLGHSQAIDPGLGHSQAVDPGLGHSQAIDPGLGHACYLSSPEYAVLRLCFVKGIKYHYITILTTGHATFHLSNASYHKLCM